MNMQTNTDDYKIVLSQFHILTFFVKAGHNMLVLIDNQENLFSELDGLATSKDGKVKPIGYLPSDRLKVYEFSSPYLYAKAQPQITLFSADRESVMTHWQAALRAMDVINKKNLPYPVLGLGKNSNSVTSTLIRCMKLNELPVPGGGIAPFAGRMVLSDAEIQEIQNELLPIQSLA